MVNAGCFIERTVPNCVINHILDLLSPVTEPAKRKGSHTVYNFEIPPPC